jgi:hypothetical protein
MAPWLITCKRFYTLKLSRSYDKTIDNLRPDFYCNLSRIAGALSTQDLPQVDRLATVSRSMVEQVSSDALWLNDAPVFYLVLCVFLLWLFWTGDKNNNWNDPLTPRVRNLTHYWFVRVVWAQVRIIPSSSDVKNSTAALYQIFATIFLSELMLCCVYLLLFISKFCYTLEFA